MAEGRQVYALFIDIMGFASAIDSLTEVEHDHLDEALRSPADWPNLLPRAVELATSYTLFHNELEDHVTTCRLFIDSAIVFSDSAFIVSQEFRVVRDIAQAMMTFCYSRRIPLREGIGYGNFARLIFSTASHPSGLLIADSPFLGSAIVRAHRAERCPAKGFRIFLHPSVQVPCEPPWMFVDLPTDEQTDHSARELSFIHESTGLLSSAEMLTLLRDMQIGVTSERVLLHYQASQRALGRHHEAGEVHGWKR